MGWVGWFFSDYRVSPNFLLCWGWVVVEVGLGCDNSHLSPKTWAWSELGNKIVSQKICCPRESNFVFQSTEMIVQDYFQLIKLFLH